MIEVQVKAVPSLVFYYEDFNQFQELTEQWYKASISPDTSAMEYILQNYNVTFYGRKVTS